MMHLLLLGTAGCHLCEQAEEIIRECLPNDYDSVIELIDIAEQEHWQAQYAICIPVISSASKKNCLAFEVADVKEFIRFFVARVG